MPQLRNSPAARTPAAKNRMWLVMVLVIGGIAAGVGYAFPQPLNETSPLPYGATTNAGAKPTALSTPSAKRSSTRSISSDPHVPMANQFVIRSGSTLYLAGKPWRFTGVNMYWLGLDENVRDFLGPTYPTHQAIDAGYRSAVQLGSRLVRGMTLGVSLGSPRSIEPELGVFNESAFHSIDYAVAAARRFGLRLMIPLMDNWHFYTGGKHTFTNWFGYRDLYHQNAGNPRQRLIEDAFYSDPRVVEAYHQYVTHILDHVNPLTGLRLGNDPTIAIWEEGNELWDAPSSWVAQTAALIKSQAPHALVAVNNGTPGQAVVTPAGVDIIDQHFYPPYAAVTNLAAANVTNRHVAYMVGEHPVFGPQLRAWLPSAAADKRISGDLAWSLFPYLPSGRPENHGDGYTFHFPASTHAESVADNLIMAHAALINAST